MFRRTRDVLRYEISRGLAYRKIVHPEMVIYNWLIPSIFSAASMIFYLFLPVKPMLLGKDGAFSLSLPIFATLPGFYIAALAAVATFGGPGMDTEMPEPPPTIKIMVKGNFIDNALSRRQFMSYLFMYLVITSFALCGFLLAGSILSGSAQHFKPAILALHFGALIWELLKASAVLVAVVLCSLVAAATLQGAFFLGERMHLPPEA